MTQRVTTIMDEQQNADFSELKNRKGAHVVMLWNGDPDAIIERTTKVLLETRAKGLGREVWARRVVASIIDMLVPRLTAEDRELVERLRTATYQVVHSYKNYSIKPDEQKRAAAALIMRLSGEKFGPPKYRDDAKE